MAKTLRELESKLWNQAEHTYQRRYNEWVVSLCCGFEQLTGTQLEEIMLLAREVLEE